MFEWRANVRPVADIRQDAGYPPLAMGATPSGSGEPAPQRPRRPGETVVLREVWRGRVWYARPATVVADEANLRAFYVPPGVVALKPVDGAGRSLRLYTDEWSLAEVRRGGNGFLSFAFPDTPYAVILGYTPSGELSEYYVNLQSPLRSTPIGFDTTEHLLDVVIPPDRSGWTWKDEDELDEAVARGWFSEHDVAWFRYWGERAIEHVLLREPPFDRNWTGWHPDPAWPAPALPDDATVLAV